MNEFRVFTPSGEHLGNLKKLPLNPATDLPEDVYILDPLGNWHYLLFSLSAVKTQAVPGHVKASALLLT